MAFKKIARFRRSLLSNRTAMVMLTAQISIAAGAFIVNILSARALGPSDRGELALFLQLAYAANLFALLGRHTAYLRYPPESGSLGAAFRETDRLSRLPMAISVVVSVVVGLAFEQWTMAALLLILGFLAKLSSGVMVNMHRAAAIAVRLGRTFLVASVVSQILLVAGAYVFLRVSLDAPEAWLLLYGFTSAIPYLATEWLVRRRSPPPVTGRDLAPISRLGYHLVPAALAEAVLARADKFLLPLLSSFAQLGVYAVVSTMTDLVTWPVKQYAESKIPSWRAAHEKGQLRWGPALLTVLTLGAVGAVAMGLVIYFSLVPLFGTDYEAGRTLVIPLSIAAVFQTVIIFGSCIHVALGRPSVVTWISLSGMIFAVPALVTFIPLWGAIGAAWAMAFGNFISAGIATAFLLRLAHTADRRGRS